MRSTLLAVILTHLMTTLINAKRKDNKLGQQIKLRNSLKCLEPQPRIIPPEDIGLAEPHIVYTPRATVLFRCGYDTGFCQNDGCYSVEQQEVQLVFNGKDTYTGHSTPIVVNAVNHTRCGCANSRTKTTSTDVPVYVNSENTNNRLNERLYEHLKEIEHYACQAPKPYLVPQQYFNLTDPQMVYTPSFIALNQCIYNIQYCALYDDINCHRIQKEEVEVHFLEFDAINKTTRTIIINTVQDKDCGCGARNTRRHLPRNELNRTSNSRNFSFVTLTMCLLLRFLVYNT